MMNALAVVSRVEIISTQPKHYQVELTCEQQTSCQSCSSKSSCATGQISKAIGAKQHQWYLSTEQTLQVGDVVEIGLSEKTLLSAAAWVYLLPILALFVGAAVGQVVAETWFQGSELVVILLSFTCALVSFQLLSRKFKRQKFENNQDVTLIRALGKSL
jgi:sigma-E factor negative regulatory protein RseC